MHCSHFIIRISIVHSWTFKLKIKRWRWHQSHFGLRTSKERPLHFTSQTILFNRVEVAISSKDLAINFEFTISAESKSE